MKKIILTTSVFFILFTPSLFYPQNINLAEISMLSQKPYTELSEAYNLQINDSIISRSYAIAYLKKAKKNNDIIKKADGYYMLAEISERSKALLYADSIIQLTTSKEGIKYPAEAHIFKARLLGSQGRYRKSMEELVIANSYANKNENIDQQYRIKYFIGLLKNNLGEYKETLYTFKSIEKYYRSKFEEDNYKNRYNYIKSIYALGNAYNDNKNYDSAYYQNKKGIDLSLKSQDSILYPNFLLSSGVTNYYTKQYQSAVDSISKFIYIYGNDTNISKIYFTTSDLYLGKIYFEQNEIDKSIHYLKKVDSTTFAQKNFFPNLRSAYEILIKSYKQKENIEKQLYYIDRLLKFDSISSKEFKHLYKTINEEYSTPNLIYKKQEIIDSLKKNNKNKIVVVIILSSVSLVLILILLFNNRKKKVYKKRFLELLHQNNNTHPKEISNSLSTHKKEEKKDPTDIGISDIIVYDILKSLKEFEENQGFLNSNITISELSKEFKTNSKYLSKVINSHKNKGFSSYINDLRVDFVIKKLKSNSKFRKYTIKAIANEIGFNTTEAFSKSFYKSTGIYPSFFLKQLEKELKNL
ncbi:helix-turn-helix domain-containing protein [Aquimarina muelleri]|uniref:HTH araC/xylS-type domain-containing protein n=1 Tax=Aquimarina muelleri TaxID=279356 RepID=A0A918N4Z5_9FLAO|nr:helix-turn-helix domain-containing protein [Aquimarina muelleri]MCX2764526.1 helix-turn-helix domain-containing protein [Aquimarina muelleri]GGX33144.1 hypothetical protein GCM10007384_37360 [Aquimarina muelleri]